MADENTQGADVIVVLPTHRTVNIPCNLNAYRMVTPEAQEAAEAGNAVPIFEDTTLHLMTHVRNALEVEWALAHPVNPLRVCKIRILTNDAATEQMLVAMCIVDFVNVDDSTHEPLVRQFCENIALQAEEKMEIRFVAGGHSLAFRAVPVPSLATVAAVSEEDEATIQASQSQQ